VFLRQSEGPELVGGMHPLARYVMVIRLEGMGACTHARRRDRGSEAKGIKFSSPPVFQERASIQSVAFIHNKSMEIKR
jgi:hypothetical protein